MLNETIRAGAFEAFVAAIYKDQGTKKTEEIVTRLFQGRIKLAEPIVSWRNKLQECVQRQERVANVSEIILYKTRRDEDSPDHAARHISEVCVRISGKDWELWGTGHGESQKDAEMDAAEKAFKTHCGDR
jgi:dsRNA-specific ribonuclease